MIFVYSTKASSVKIYTPTVKGTDKILDYSGYIRGGTKCTLLVTHTRGW